MKIKKRKKIEFLIIILLISRKILVDTILSLQILPLCLILLNTYSKNYFNLYNTKFENFSIIKLILYYINFYF